VAAALAARERQQEEERSDEGTYTARLEQVETETVRLHNAVAALEATKADAAALGPLRRLGALQERLAEKADRAEMQLLRETLDALAESLTTGTNDAQPAAAPQQDTSLAGAITRQPLHCLTCDRPLPRTEPREASVVTKQMPRASGSMPQILYKIRPSVKMRVDAAARRYGRSPASKTILTEHRCLFCARYSRALW
jgi:hypothetical protein